MNKLPKRDQGKAKERLKDIWMASARSEAEKSFDFPSEHWKHLRTSNPIESVFSSVKIRTRKARGCLSRTTALTMAFRLMLCAQKKWQKLNGSNLLAEVIDNVKFTDGIREERIAA